MFQEVSRWVLRANTILDIVTRPITPEMSVLNLRYFDYLSNPEEIQRQTKFVSRNMFAGRSTLYNLLLSHCIIANIVYLQMV